MNREEVCRQCGLRRFTVLHGLCSACWREVEASKQKHPSNGRQ